MHKAPGKSDREGISLIELMDMFPSDDVAREWFESRIWLSVLKPDVTDAYPVALIAWVLFGNYMPKCHLAIALNGTLV